MQEKEAAVMRSGMQRAARGGHRWRWVVWSGQEKSGSYQLIVHNGGIRYWFFIEERSEVVVFQRGAALRKWVWKKKCEMN